MSSSSEMLRNLRNGETLHEDNIPYFRRRVMVENAREFDAKFVACSNLGMNSEGKIEFKRKSKIIFRGKYFRFLIKRFIQ